MTVGQYQGFAHPKMQLATGLIAALLVLFCQPVRAVSLGQEVVLSALGDPVEVEIDVLQWEDADLGQVQISLASPSDYETFKLNWLPVLLDLNFNVVGPNLDGDVKILISTRDPVVEPYLELLLVMRWPGGSLLREYVLLFDLPETAPRRVTAATLPATATPATTTTANFQERVLEPVSAPVPAEIPGSQVAEDPTTLPATAAALLPVVETLPAVKAEAQALTVVEPPALAAPVREIVQRVSARPAPQLVPEPIVPEREPVAEAAAAADEQAPEARSQTAIEVETVSTVPAPAVQGAATGRRLYQVRDADILWNIAQQFLPAGAGDNIYQMLLSLHDLNRASFINGNISLLKANALLQIPGVADINKIDADSAQTIFEQRWNEGTQRLQTALRGEPLPEFSALYNEPVTVAESEPTGEARVPGTETGRTNAHSDGLILPANTPVVVPMSDADAESLVINEADAAVQATGPATTTTTSNPYLERITTSARQVQTRLQARSQQAAQLEQQLVEMRNKMQETQERAARINAALESTLAQRAASGNRTLGMLALAMLVALVLAFAMILKLLGQRQMRNRGHIRAPEKLVLRDPGGRNTTARHQVAARTNFRSALTESPAGTEGYSVTELSVTTGLPVTTEFPAATTELPEKNEGIKGAEAEDAALQQELMAVMGTNAGAAAEIDEKVQAK